jgi:hypothetical protein
MLRAPTWKMSAVAADQLDLADVHHLGDELQVVRVGRAPQHLQPLLAEPLEAVGRAARLERAAAQDLGTGALDRRRRGRVTCSSVSAEQGPAITITSSPPIRTSSTVTTVSSGRNVRLARLYGSVIRSTSCTRRGGRSAPDRLCVRPTTPSTVRVAPDERCTSMPSSMRRAMTASTASICASVARSFITTTMTRYGEHGLKPDATDAGPAEAGATATFSVR